MLQQNCCEEGKLHGMTGDLVELIPINYCLISVTPTYAKVFEKLFLNQLVVYLEKYALLTRKHFGFKSRKSSTAVLYFVEKIVGNKEDNNNTGAVFLDLATAFNSNAH